MVIDIIFFAGISVKQSLLICECVWLRSESLQTIHDLPCYRANKGNGKTKFARACMHVYTVQEVIKKR